MTTEERFWKKVNKTDGCWIWGGSKTHNGYGQFHSPGSYRAHRYSWEIKNGNIPDGKMVLHSCDNRLCVNPDHLFLGDAKDNANDMISKGRDRKDPVRGEQHYNAKLSNQDVEEIRSRLVVGESLANLARDYGVTRQMIFRIKKGLNWKKE